MTPGNKGRRIFIYLLISKPLRSSKPQSLSLIIRAQVEPTWVKLAHLRMVYKFVFLGNILIGVYM